MLSSTIIWTLLLEGGLLLALFRCDLRLAADRWLFGACVVLNLLTQLGLIFALHAFYPLYWPTLAVGEVLIVLTEAGGYALVGRKVQPIWRRSGETLPLTARNAFWLSLGLNVFSFVVGLGLPLSVRSLVISLIGR